jgi:hypothetical protein
MTRSIRAVTRRAHANRRRGGRRRRCRASGGPLESRAVDAWAYLPAINALLLAPAGRAAATRGRLVSAQREECRCLSLSST